MSSHDQQDHDWLNDPFDEKKQAEEAEQARMTRGSKSIITILALLALPAAYFIFTALALFLWIIVGEGGPWSDAIGGVAFTLMFLPSGLTRLIFHA